MLDFQMFRMCMGGSGVYSQKRSAEMCAKEILSGTSSCLKCRLGSNPEVARLLLRESGATTGHLLTRRRVVHADLHSASTSS